MKIKNTKYKNVDAVEVSAEKLTCVFLPNNGARLQLIYDNETGKQFLTEEHGDVFLPQDLNSVYVKQNVSGADDMFPTIDPITWNEGARIGKKYLDHGSVARLPFNVFAENDKLVMETIDTDLSFKYRKIISETSDGFLNIRNEITELGVEDFHCYWAFHIMIQGEEGAITETPYSEKNEAKMCFDVKNVFGKRFDSVYPGKEMLTQQKFSKESNAYKFFWLDKIPEGYVKYKSPKSKSLKLTYDKEKLPFVGVWVNNGEFKGLYNTAIEIATGPFDSPSNSIENGVDFVINKGETFGFDIKLEVELQK